MLGRTHMAVAAATYCAYDLPTTWNEVPMWAMGLGTAVFTSLLPDITEPRSRIGGILLPLVPSWLRPFAFLVLGAMLIYFGWRNQSLMSLATGLVLILLVLVKNRESPTHGFVGIGVILSIAWAYYPQLWIPVLIGYGSHLVLDFLSEKIALFSPLSTRRFGITLVRTGSFAERLIFYRGAYVLGLLLLYQTYFLL